MLLTLDEVRQEALGNVDGNFYNLFNKFQRAGNQESLANEIIDDLLCRGIGDELIPVFVDLVLSAREDVANHSIVRLLNSEVEPVISDHVVWRLEGSNRKEFIPLIERLLRKSTNSSTKVRCLHTLFFFDDNSVTDIIASVKHDPTPVPDYHATVGQIASNLLREKLNKISSGKVH